MDIFKSYEIIQNELAKIKIKVGSFTFHDETFGNFSISFEYKGVTSSFVSDKMQLFYYPVYNNYELAQMVVPWIPYSDEEEIIKIVHSSLGLL